mmetsp:Transcript_24080/g.58150  ORF Transcript_24080/g.58150 Transcript_24080/m.58150 type:complete len:322 (-) Transcript_24080:113-1078(-)
MVRQGSDRRGVVGDDPQRLRGEVGPRKQQDRSRRDHPVGRIRDVVLFGLGVRRRLGKRSVIIAIVLLLFSQPFQPLLFLPLVLPFLPRRRARRHQQVQILPLDQRRVPPQSKLPALPPRHDAAVRADHPANVERRDVVKFDHAVASHARGRIPVRPGRAQRQYRADVGAVRFDEFEASRGPGLVGPVAPPARDRGRGGASCCAPGGRGRGGGGGGALPEFDDPVRAAGDDVSVSQGGGAVRDGLAMHVGYLVVLGGGDVPQGIRGGGVSFFVDGGGRIGGHGGVFLPMPLFARGGVHIVSRAASNNYRGLLIHLSGVGVRR